MKKISLIDTTLSRAYDLRKAALSFKERLEIATAADRLHADVIEIPPMNGTKADELFLKTVASAMKSTVSACLEITGDLEESAWQCVKNARKPRLNLVVPSSPVQMEYYGHMKAPAMLEKVAEKLDKITKLCPDTELTAVDATRAERDFLLALIKSAADAGVKSFTLCDTAGIFLPDEMADFIEELKKDAPELEKMTLNVQISDEMHMAAACAAAAIERGAEGVKCTAMQAGFTTYDSIARLVRLKGSELGIAINLHVTELARSVAQMERIITPQRNVDKPVTARGSGDMTNVTLDKNDDITEVIKVVNQLGYDLSEEDNAAVYEAFKRIAVKKQFVGTRELDAIVASTALQVPPTYRIDSYVINSGNVITATAHIRLIKDGEKLESVAVGDGPIDASFLAIEQIIGHHYEMDDFAIQTVTEGAEAMGSALVKLRSGGKVFSGSGISTDIIGAAVRAYVSALNKIVYEGE